MSFFLDNTFPRRFGALLRAMDVNVRHLQEVEQFNGSTPDEAWMPYVAAQGWTAVSGDHRILKNPHERHLWQSLRLTLFCVYKGYTKLPLWEQAKFVISHWPKIEEGARRARAGEAHQIGMNGKIERID